jgi:serine/threonine protein kinase
VIRIRVALDDNRVVEKNAIHSESGALYVLDRDIKKAIYGKVMLGFPVLSNESGFFRRSGTPVAIKVVTEANLRQFHGISQEDPIKEISALDFIGHHVPSIVPPFIPSYIPHISHINVTHMLECNTDETYVFMVLEYIDGVELFDYIDSRNKQGLDEPTARKIFTDIVRGLSVLHGMGICHRDMSMENVMVTNDLSRAVIIDLGMALRVERDPHTGEFYPFPNQGQCGKVPYMAPEVVANSASFDGAAADIWALGIILFALLAGFPPLEVASLVDPRYRRLVNGRLSSLIREWQLPISDDAVNLICGILRPLPLNRLTLDQILSHKWMNIPDDTSGGVADFPMSVIDAL